MRSLLRASELWRKAGNPDGCLEKRIRRRLTPHDFPRGHRLNALPGSRRLRERRDGAYKPLRFTWSLESGMM
jgi:hypothetical protein